MGFGVEGRSPRARIDLSILYVRPSGISFAYPMSVIHF